MARTNSLETLDRVIASLHQVRDTLSDDAPRVPPGERLGRYIDAPVWPWFAAGWVVGALFVLLFVLAWSHGRT